MTIFNNNCDGYKLTLKACYFLWICNSPEVKEVQDNICDDPCNNT